MIKIALNAGHFLGTKGKRCLKSLDPSETKEWVLNSRICEMVEEIIKAYPDAEILRIDDKTGKTDISLSERARKANEYGADIYISVHHNAGAAGGSAGGTVVYTYPEVDTKTRILQSEIYYEIIKNTGLRGNRSKPLASADLAECRETKMPAVLIECGFMDSASDVPVILTDDFAKKVAESIVNAVAKIYSLKKTEPQILYRVQVGAFAEKQNAEALKEKLNSAGFSAFIKAEKQ